jgi:molecular chaperone GrpE
MSDAFEEEPFEPEESPPTAEAAAPAAEPSVEDVDDAVAEAEAALEGDIGRLTAERDEFRALAQRIQADFENYRKQMVKRQTDHLERASEELVEKLLPVLDACDAALAHGASDVEPVHSALLTVLEKEGLERLDPAGEAFDPNVHEAVMHEAGDGGEPVVSEVLRTGYRFKGRVLRPAMVKVSG